MAGSNVPIDVPLTNISVAAYQDSDGFIADKIFPTVPVDEQSGLFYTWDETELNRDTAERRADATESAGDGYEIGNDHYRAEVWALHRDVGDQMQKNYTRTPIQPFAGAARFLVNKMRIRQEVDFFAKFGVTGVWANEVSGVASGTPTDDQFLQFSNDASDPVAVAEDIKNRVSDGTGLEVNKIALGKKVWSVLKNHPAIIERFKYTTADNVSLQILANLLEVDQVLVAKAIVNQAKAGQGIDNVRLFDKSMLFVHAADTPGIETPTAGYTFMWTGISDGLGETIGTKQFRMEQLAADRVESQIAFDHQVIAPNLGVLATNVVA